MWLFWGARLCVYFGGVVGLLVWFGFGFVFKVVVVLCVLVSFDVVRFAHWNSSCVEFVVLFLMIGFCCFGFYMLFGVCGIGGCVGL